MSKQKMNPAIRLSGLPPCEAASTSNVMIDCAREIMTAHVFVVLECFVISTLNTILRSRQERWTQILT